MGTLLPNCRVRYVAPTLLSGVAGGLPLASFTFAAEAAGAEGAVAIHSTGPCEPLPLDALEINDSDRFHVLPLGGLCSDGLNPRVQIITPPQGAILASLRPTFNVDKHFGNNVVQNLIQHFVAGDMGAVAQYVQPMLSFPSEVDDAFGVVLLASAPGFTGSASSHMEYRWLSPYANDSAVYRVEVNVEGPSDRIHVLQPLMATNATDGSIDITLTAESGGGAQSPEPDMLFHVTRGPYFGALRQVSVITSPLAGGRGVCLDCSIRASATTIPCPSLGFIYVSIAAALSRCKPLAYLPSLRSPVNSSVAQGPRDVTSRL